MTTKEKFKENEDYGNRVSDSNLNLNNECKVSIPIYCHPKSSAHKKNDTMESDGNCQGVKLQKMLKLRSNDLKRTISDAAMRLNDTFSFANNSNVDHHIVVYENFFYRTDYEKMEKQKHETNQQSQYKIDFCKQQADGPMKKTTMGFKANIKMLNPTKPTSLQPQFIIAMIDYLPLMTLAPRSNRLPTFGSQIVDLHNRLHARSHI